MDGEGSESGGPLPSPRVHVMNDDDGDRDSAPPSVVDLANVRYEDTFLFHKLAVPGKVDLTKPRPQEIVNRMVADRLVLGDHPSVVSSTVVSAAPPTPPTPAFPLRASPSRQQFPSPGQTPSPSPLRALPKFHGDDQDQDQHEGDVHPHPHHRFQPQSRRALSPIHEHHSAGRRKGGPSGRDIASRFTNDSPVEPHPNPHAGPSEVPAPVPVIPTMGSEVPDLRSSASNPAVPHPHLNPNPYPDVGAIPRNETAFERRVRLLMEAGNGVGSNPAGRGMSPARSAVESSASHPGYTSTHHRHRHRPTGYSRRRRGSSPDGSEPSGAASVRSSSTSYASTRTRATRTSRASRGSRGSEGSRSSVSRHKAPRSPHRHRRHRSKRDIEEEEAIDRANKEEYIRELDKLAFEGVILGIVPSMSMETWRLRHELERHVRNQTLVRRANFMKNIIKLSAFTLQLVFGRVLNLAGWAEFIAASVDTGEHDASLEQAYRTIWKKGTPNPWMDLSVFIFGSAIMFHFGVPMQAAGGGGGGGSANGGGSGGGSGGGGGGFGSLFQGLMGGLAQSFGGGGGGNLSIGGILQGLMGGFASAGMRGRASPVGSHSPPQTPTSGHGHPQTPTPSPQTPFQDAQSRLRRPSPPPQRPDVPFNGSVPGSGVGAPVPPRPRVPVAAPQ